MKSKAFLSMGILTVIVLIGIIMLIMIPLVSVMSFQRSETKRALYYTKKLQDGINSVCDNGNEKEIQIRIDQQIPNKLIRGVYITKNGDPDNIIYYEYTEPGTAYAWENYYKEYPKHLLFINFNSSNNGNIENYKKKLESFIGNETVTANDTIRELNNNRPLLMEETSLKLFYPVITNIEESEENKNYFIPVKGLLGNVKYYIINVSEMEDPMMYKYEFCRNNSLCLKTNNGIYAFPLDDNCDKISDILVKIDASNPTFTSAPMHEIIASPCISNVKINKVNCNCNIIGKKYEIDEKKLKFIGYKKLCTIDNKGSEKCILLTLTPDDTKDGIFCTQTKATNINLNHWRIFQSCNPIHSGTNSTIILKDTFSNHACNSKNYFRWPTHSS